MAATRERACLERIGQYNTGLQKFSEFRKAKVRFLIGNTSCIFLFHNQLANDQFLGFFVQVCYQLTSF